MDQEGDIAAAVRPVTVAVLNQDGSVVMDEETVTRAAAEDPKYQLLLSKVQSGDWHPHKPQETPCLRPYYAVRDRLAVIEDLVTYTFGEGSVRLVIYLPPSATESLPASTQGIRGSTPCYGGPDTQYIGQAWRATFSTTAICARIVRSIPRDFPQSR